MLSKILLSGDNITLQRIGGNVTPEAKQRGGLPQYNRAAGLYAGPPDYRFLLFTNSSDACDPLGRQPSVA
jgi:hypothetical protein